ncbi:MULTISPECIES: alkaline phosphatase family protein [Nocardia]|uniref:alkaline phosphatase family protein n=1 Tax=Nocardia TaxID=1817 RepID=UPI0018D4812A|nr:MULTISPECIES: alkaline phosphatase family protein [Nocardia]MCC3316717.1 alkaline phosphatase family protein [Nocardia africana]
MSVLVGAAALTIAAVVVPGPASAVAVPGFDHIVVVMFENIGYDTIIGTASAPYFNQLADTGALFTDSHALTHPSQPNYIALFSGATQGVVDDSCPYDVTGVDNLGTRLAAAGHSFAGYAESMPTPGYTACTGSNGLYARKHNGWVNFDNVAASANQPLAAFPADYSRLPTISFVNPNMCNDMHDCPVSAGDAWLRDNLGRYADWAKANRSLLVVTFDEDEGTAANHIPTIFFGAGVAPGKYGERIDHYSVLRTLEDAYGLAPVAESAHAAPITDVWLPAPGGVPLPSTGSH